MGQQDVQRTQDEAALRHFSRQLIQDVRALEYMLAEGLFENGVRRIGAEQELFLIDEYGHPAPLIEEVMARNENPAVVTELTRFNLEINLDPQLFGGDCLSRMERQLLDTLDYARRISNEVGAHIVMAGILPTIHISDLTLDNMTPKPRYYALNEAIQRLRGGPGQFQIRGVDEFYVQHDSIMLEGANTSFQTHFQVSPEEFARFYNIAQVVAAPCLAAATNSPLLFGKRLWKETRIALFQQAVDTRSSNLYLREMSPRVHFGSGWVRESVTEIFKEDIARFRVLLTTELEEDPFEVLRRGEMPKLHALQLHNGSVYRWNRAVYGVTDSKAHLRIENRILPAGPTPIDEFANAAFWFGLVSCLASDYEDVTEHITFDDAKNNFVAAARMGLASHLVWLDGKRTPAPDLILRTLLPMAHKGLRASGLDAADIDRYLGVLEARVQTGRTGSQWQLDSLAQMRSSPSTRTERLCALVTSMSELQQEGRPVHEWPLADLTVLSARERIQNTRVEHFMSTDLFTVQEDDLVEFVACLMDWQRIRHVLVEDNQHRLAGLISHRSVLRYLARFGPSNKGEAGVPVKDIMIRNPISVGPETPTYEAVQLMRRQRIGALPVVRDGQLVGIVTERDFLNIAGKLLDEELGEEDFLAERP